MYNIILTEIDDAFLDDAGIASCFYQHNKNVNCGYATYAITDIADLVDVIQAPRK